MGEFKPEDSSKMNFYLAAADDLLRHPTDQPTIGLILSKNQNRVVAEYALRGLSQPIGVAEWQLTTTLPAELRRSLPTSEELDAVLGKPRRRVKDRPAEVCGSAVCFCWPYSARSGVAVQVIQDGWSVRVFLFNRRQFPV